MKKNYLAKKSSGILKTIRTIAVLFLLVFSYNPSLAQGVSCTAATAVNVNQVYTGFSISDTTVNDPTTSCAGQNNVRDGWFTFSASGTEARIVVTTGNRNPIIYAYSGACGVAGAGLTLLGCANATTTATGHTETLALTGLTSGVTYFVRVANSTGNNMPISSFVILTNDNCTNPIALTVNTTPTCTTSYNGTTVGASQSLAGCEGNADDDVWFRFTPTATSHVITVTPNTLNNAVFEVFAGTCASPGAGLCINDTNAANLEVASITGFVVGQPYLVRVYSAGNANNVGSFNICITSPPVNNQCTNATNLPCGTTNLAGSTIGTASYVHGSSCAMSNYGVWYSFVGDGNISTVSATTTAFDLEMSISSGACGSLTNIACRDTAGSSGTESYTFRTTVGVTYYIYIAHYNTGSTIGSFTISRSCTAPTVANDECSGAIALTPSTTCTYTNYTNVNSSASTGMTNPSCAEFAGRDVWFSVVVPATGQITVDTQTGTLNDSGLALYSGTCGALTLLDCDDDSSVNGAMSSLTRTGLTPGSTVYLRVFGYEGATGTFGICVTTPSCPSPSGLYADILSATSVTVNWTPSTPPASGGYQYFVNTTGVAPVAGSTPTGTTAPGVNSVTLSPLTTGQKYYFWVRSFCGGSDVSLWFGPTNYTPCAIGDGNGHTTLGCVTPITGGQGSGGTDPSPVSCSTSTCTTLEVSYLPLKQTTDYIVEPITYDPPYQFTCLRTPVSVNIDDRWSPVINLPFPFCFYGNSYTSCLIGSNGVLTFNTSGANYTPGGPSDWQFNTNLPSPNLFLNTIFGVYHDIDPSIGGEVGWELITLNSGCRALVAAWNEIPMYSCTNRYYTGMIVLYENTNVIEVYIQDKNICGSWNGGNAVVGVQNANGTAAVTAPGRNSLDTNWTVTNEAWRFTPNGPSINPVVNWYQGNPTTGTLIATGVDTVNVCPASTTSYTAQVTYPLCTGNLVLTDPTTVTVTNTKIWNGSVGYDWNVDANWTPSGRPTSTNCVIIPQVGNGRYPTISGAPNGVGYNLSVYNNASLTVNPDQNLIITDGINVQTSGSFTIQNNANLIQINDAATNNGSIFYKRIAPSIEGSDYVYWSSPVFNQNIDSFYDVAFPYTPGFKYQWNPILNNNNGAGGNISQGLWEGASGAMTRARGYIIRGSNNFNMPTSNIPTTFTGVPFNGLIPYTIQRGNYTGAPYNGANGIPITNMNDNYNLVGNPYPSSINALEFLQTNSYDALNNPSGTILGNVKLWTHGIDPIQGATNPFYGSFSYNYSLGDYLTINYMGSTLPGLPDIIRSGQAFFVQMIDGAAGSANITFNNGMRLDSSNLPYTNSGFFKNGTVANSEFSMERSRIWLDLVDSNSQSSRLLLGYATDATNGYDNLFDAITGTNGLKLYSKIENNQDVFDIQGRSLPFDVNDQVPVGINVPTAGNYTFAIASLDGLFESQNIYLQDDLLGITHNLKANPYHFATISGNISDRFKIVYVDAALGTPILSFDNSVRVLVNEEVTVNSSNLEMKSIVVYNLLGQTIDTFENINSNSLILSNLRKNNTTLLLKIKLETGETVTKKIIF